MTTGRFTPTPVYHPDDSTKVVWSGRGRRSAAYKQLVAEGKIIVTPKPVKVKAVKAPAATETASTTDSK